MIPSNGLPSTVTSLGIDSNPNRQPVQTTGQLEGHKVTTSRPETSSLVNTVVAQDRLTLKEVKNSKPISLEQLSKMSNPKELLQTHISKSNASKLAGEAKHLSSKAESGLKRAEAAKEKYVECHTLLKEKTGKDDEVKLKANLKEALTTIKQEAKNIQEYATEIAQKTKTLSKEVQQFNKSIQSFQKAKLFTSIKKLMDQVKLILTPISKKEEAKKVLEQTQAELASIEKNLKEMKSIRKTTAKSLEAIKLNAKNVNTVSKEATKTAMIEEDLQKYDLLIQTMEKTGFY